MVERSIGRPGLSREDLRGLARTHFFEAPNRLTSSGQSNLRLLHQHSMPDSPARMANPRAAHYERIGCSAPQVNHPHPQKWSRILEPASHASRTPSQCAARCTSASSPCSPL